MAELGPAKGTVGRYVLVLLCYVLCLLRSAALFRAVPYDAMPMPWPETICRLASSGSWICELCGCVCASVSVCATVRPGIMVEDKEDKGRGPCEEEPTGPQLSRVSIHRLILVSESTSLLCHGMGQSGKVYVVDVDVVVVGEVDVRSRC